MCVHVEAGGGYQVSCSVTLLRPRQVSPVTFLSLSPTALWFQACM